MRRMPPALRGVAWQTVLLAMAVGALGCSGPKSARAGWEGDLYYTHRLHIDGQHALAAERFATLRKRAKKPSDADDAGLMACESLRRAKNAPAAAACFDELANSASTVELRTRALLHAAQVRYDDLTDRKAALLMFAELIRQAPGTPAGLRAIDGLTNHGRLGLPKLRAMVALMLKLERENPRSPLADNLMLRAAMLLDEFGTDQARRRAIGLLTRLEARHRNSAALLPALMLRSRLHRGFREPRMEAVALRAIVRTYETSHVFGTYVEPFHIRAMERLASLYAGPLRKPARAEAMLERLRRVVHETKDTYRYLAALARLREQRGELRGAIKAWRELLAHAGDADRDMRRNDERICKEIDKRDRRRECLLQVRAYGPLPVKEVPRARAAIARLQRRIDGGGGR